MRYFTNVHDLGDLKTALAEAFEIKKDRYKYENLGKHKTCLLIFFNNSLRTRLSTQKAARNLGMDARSGPAGRRRRSCGRSAAWLSTSWPRATWPAR